MRHSFRTELLFNLEVGFLERMVFSPFTGINKNPCQNCWHPQGPTSSSSIIITTTIKATLKLQGISNKWLASYLSNRKQFVSIKGYKSNLADVRCGVPQCSILVPLLFLIYIND